jgi:amidohydrolase
MGHIRQANPNNLRPRGMDARIANFVEVDLAAHVESYREELITFRRRLHQHPEVAFKEQRATQWLHDRLQAAGLSPRILPCGTGLACDVGSGPEGVGSVVALRADLDALPIDDEKDVPYRSAVAGVAHACGHDVHTAVVLGAGLVLLDLSKDMALPHTVRLIFQPAEETAAGALEVLRSGELGGVHKVLALHCDPSLEVGMIGLRSGAITSACDFITLELAHSPAAAETGRGRVNLVAAWAAINSSLANAISRQRDVASPISVIWGQISGADDAATNGAPHVVARGTVRCLDEATWRSAADRLRGLIDNFAAANGVEAKVTYDRGTPPTVNDPLITAEFESAVALALGPLNVSQAEQSLGGEDFAWYLRDIPGSLVRLGVRNPADVIRRDLHQGSFDVDESAIEIGVRAFVAAALLSEPFPPSPSV